jgi:hypothetical protein
MGSVDQRLRHMSESPGARARGRAPVPDEATKHQRTLGTYHVTLVVELDDNPLLGAEAHTSELVVGVEREAHMRVIDANCEGDER